MDSLILQDLGLSRGAVVKGDEIGCQLILFSIICSAEGLNTPWTGYQLINVLYSVDNAGHSNDSF